MQARTIHPVPTSVTAFVGGAAQGPVDEPVAVHSLAEYETQFGPLASGSAMRLHPAADRRRRPEPGLIAAAAAYCERKRAMFLIDAPPGWTSAAAAISGFRNLGTTSANAAVFFPRLAGPGSAPCGAIAGVFACTDAAHGVWKAPAGAGAALRGATAISIALSESDIHSLNAAAINCLRSFPTTGAVVVWGARTAQGADTAQSEWKYIPVRRLALFIETSIDRGTKWAVFEPNAQPLWSELANSVAAFLQNLFLQGAFQGSTPHQAYFVRCDATTTTQADIDAGIVNIVVGFAPLKRKGRDPAAPYRQGTRDEAERVAVRFARVPLKPAEFVVLKIQQRAGCKLHSGQAAVSL